MLPDPPCAATLDAVLTDALARSRDHYRRERRTVNVLVALGVGLCAFAVLSQPDAGIRLMDGPTMATFLTGVLVLVYGLRRGLLLPVPEQTTAHDLLQRGYAPLNGWEIAELRKAVADAPDLRDAIEQRLATGASLYDADFEAIVMHLGLRGMPLPSLDDPALRVAEVADRVR